MIRPGCWKLHHYIESMLWWCECAEDKNPLFHYFPITKEDIQEEIEFVKECYERNTNTTLVLSMMVDKKRKRYDERI